MHRRFSWLFCGRLTARRSGSFIRARAFSIVQALFFGRAFNSKGKKQEHDDSYNGEDVS